MDFCYDPVPLESLKGAGRIGSTVEVYSLPNGTVVDVSECPVRNQVHTLTGTFQGFPNRTKITDRKNSLGHLIQSPASA